MKKIKSKNNHLFKSVNLVDCPTCNGSGTIKHFPYYSILMPDEVDKVCETCKGKGKIIIIDSSYEFYRKEDM